MEAVGEWLRFADMDLRAAEHLATLPDQEPLVCFHAQQAAEKALKAYLIWLGAADVPRTHDLDTLADRILDRAGSEPPGDALAELTDYGVVPRYPGSRSFGETEMAEALSAAKAIRDFVLGCVEGADDGGVADADEGATSEG